MNLNLEHIIDEDDDDETVILLIPFKNDDRKIRVSSVCSRDCASPIIFAKVNKAIESNDIAKDNICSSNLVFLPKDIRPWCPQSFGPELEKHGQTMILSRQNLPFFSYSFLSHIMLYSIFICINLPGQCHEGGERPQEVGRG